MAEIVLKHVQKVYPNNESKKKGFFGKKKKTEEKKHNLCGASTCQVILE